jgi:hypothetical protein
MTESEKADAPLERDERLRRVVIICESFTRNLAYFRVGSAHMSQLSDAHPHISFWVQTTNNFLDLCVLEWCKLFGERDRDRREYGWGEHGWRAIVTDQTAFEARLLTDLNKTAKQFGKLAEKARYYRDKFVAHLDTGRVMEPPFLDAALKSLWFYHRYVVEKEAANGNLHGRVDSAAEMERYFQRCVEEATQIYSQIAL